MTQKKPITKAEAESLFAEEYEDTYDMEGFTYQEIVTMRQLVNDRIENRFVYAAKAAQGMDAKMLTAVTDEINRLKVLQSKLMEETQHE